MRGENSTSTKKLFDEDSPDEDEIDELFSSTNIQEKRCFENMEPGQSITCYDFCLGETGARSAPFSIYRPQLINITVNFIKSVPRA